MKRTFDQWFDTYVTQSLRGLLGSQPVPVSPPRRRYSLRPDIVQKLFTVSLLPKAGRAVYDTETGRLYIGTADPEVFQIFAVKRLTVCKPLP